MKINWKSKNPYLNLIRETNKVLQATLSERQKINHINFILSKDFSGNWLFSHPSHKFLGDKVPCVEDKVDNNPFYCFLSSMREVVSKQDAITLLEKEMAWFKNNYIRVEDWAVTG